MEPRLRILHLEDEPNDSELVQAMLTHAGLSNEIFRVETRDEFVTALQAREFDLILCNKTLPTFDGLRALELARELRPDAPFVFISGALGQVAIESLKYGATDYVIKHRSAQLASVTERVLKKVQAQREHEKAETQVRAIDTRFRALIEHSADAIVLTDAQGIVTYTSPSLSNILGGDPQFWIGGNWLNRVHPDDVGAVAESFRELTQTPNASQTLEFRYRHSDESWLWLEVTGTNLLEEPNVQAIVGNVRDISARKTSEEKLAQSENRFRALIENNADAIVLVDAKGTVLYGSPSAETVLGTPPRELIGKGAFEGIHPDDAAKVQTLFARLLENPRVPFSVQMRFIQRDGTWRWIDATTTNLLDDPSVQAIVANYRDITDRRQVEEIRELMATIVESTEDAIYSITLEGIVTSWNRGAEKMYGYRAAEMLGKAVSVLVPPERMQELRDHLAKMNRGENVLLFETERMRADGQRIDVSLTISLFRDALGNYVGAAVIARDITEQKRAEASIKKQAAEFAAVYQTANELAQHTELDVVLQTVIERATSLLGASGGALHFYDPLAQELQVVVQTGTALPVETRIPLGKGIAGRVAESHAPMVVNDYPTWEHRLGDLPNLGLGASMVVPMLYQGALIGVVAVNEVRPHRAFTEDDVSLLSLFASYAASAIHNARLFEETKRSAAQLSTLNEVARVVSTLGNVETTLELIYQQVKQILSLDVFYVCLFNAETNLVTYRLMYDEGERYEERTDQLLEGTNLSEVLHKGISILLNRSPTESGETDAQGRLGNRRKASCSLLFVPLRVGTRVFGAISAQSYTLTAYSKEQLTLLNGIANQAAIALENARLFESAQQQLERLAALRAVDLAISGSHDLCFMLDVVLDQVLNQLRVDAAAIFTLSPYRHALEFASGKGFKTNHIERARLHVREGLAGSIAWERKTIHVQNLASIQQYEREAWGAEENFVGYSGTPLIVKGQVKGVLQVFHRAPLYANQEWLDFFETIAAQAAIAMDNAKLFENLQRSNMELRLAYDTTIEGWSRALDLRDKETEGHTQRVMELTLRLARAMSVQEEDLIHMRRGALLHDIGKMGIPDEVLLKPGALSEREWEIMRQHPVFAYELLSSIQYLGPALVIPYCHHEKWDGTGYPRGLKGEQIPLEARIFAIVDVWDALLSDRPYRLAWQADKVREHIRSLSGKHFDPHVVEVFMNLVHQKPNGYE